MNRTAVVCRDVRPQRFLVHVLVEPRRAVTRRAHDLVIHPTTLLCAGLRGLPVQYTSGFRTVRRRAREGMRRECSVVELDEILLGATGTGLLHQEFGSGCKGLLVAECISS